MQTLSLVVIFIGMCGFGSGVLYLLLKIANNSEQMVYKLCCIDKKFQDILSKLQ